MMSAVSFISSSANSYHAESVHNLLPSYIMPIENISSHSFHLLKNQKPIKIHVTQAEHSREAGRLLADVWIELCAPTKRIQVNTLMELHIAEEREGQEDDP